MRASTLGDEHALARIAGALAAFERKLHVEEGHARDGRRARSPRAGWWRAASRMSRIEHVPGTDLLLDHVEAQALQRGDGVHGGFFTSPAFGGQTLNFRRGLAVRKRRRLAQSARSSMIAIDHRHHDQGQQRRRDHAADHGLAHRRTLLRAFAEREGERHHAEDHRERGHEDRAQPHARRVAAGRLRAPSAGPARVIGIAIVAGHAGLARTDREVDQEDRVLGDQAHQHHHADDREHR